jgi:hypothetical protein
MIDIFSFLIMSQSQHSYGFEYETVKIIQGDSRFRQHLTRTIAQIVVTALKYADMASTRSWMRNLKLHMCSIARTVETALRNVLLVVFHSEKHQLSRC